MTDTTGTTGTDDRRQKAQEIAQALWDRWFSGTRSWLAQVGSWAPLEADVDEVEPDIGGQYATLALGGIVEVHQRVFAGVDLIGFHLVFPDDVDVATVVAQAAGALDAAVIGRVDMLVRTAGATEPTGLVSQTGGLKFHEYTDDDGWHVVGRMKVAMAMAVVDPEEDARLAAELADAEAARERAIAEVEGASLPPAVTAEPEVPITPADDEAPAALVTEPAPAVEVEGEDEVKVEGASADAAKKAPAKKAAAKKASS